MVELCDICVGDRVKIVNRLDAYLCDVDVDEIMRIHEGQVMTVYEVHDGYIYVEEDYGECPKEWNCGSRRWRWNKHCIDFVIHNEEYDSDLDLSVDDLINELIGGFINE